MTVYQVYRKDTKEIIARTIDDFDGAVRKANAFREVYGDDYYVMRVDAVYTTHTAEDDFNATRSPASPSSVQRAADHQRGE